MKCKFQELSSKALLEHRLYFIFSFWAPVAELSSWESDLTVHKPWCLLYGPLQKDFANLALQKGFDDWIIASQHQE